MTITVMSDYLVFPVYTHATNKQLVFRYEGETVYQLTLKLDNASPDFYAYIDVSRFKGKDLELSVTPEMEISFRETNELDIDNVYREANRPQIHFTVKNGFLMSPKDIVYADGTYHLFYFCNPADNKGGYAHLGHATSKDLIHWQEEKNAAFPDEKGILDCESVMKVYGVCEGSEIFALSDSEGNKKWISMDETGKYFVGRIENGQFLSEQSAQTFRYGSDIFIGKNVSGLTNERVIRMDLTPWKAPRFLFCGQMEIPTELSLKKYKDTYYLQALPIEEISALYKNTNCYENIRVDKTENVEIPLADAAHLIRLKGKFDENAVLDIELFGRRIRVDFSENLISVGNNQVPVYVSQKTLDLTLVVDRCGVELFADGGKIYLSSLSEDSMMDRNLLSFVFSCNQEYSFDFAEFHALEPIWQTSPKIF